MLRSMGLRLRFARMAVYSIALVAPAAAQLDSTALRAKFGPPLNREIFHVAAGFDLTVDYSPVSTQVCRLQVPSHMPTKEAVSNATDMNRKMYDFLEDLVPASLRGQQLTRSVFMNGALSQTSIDYEHVRVSETHSSNDPFSGAIVVVFKGGGCETTVSGN